MYELEKTYEQIQHEYEAKFVALEKDYAAKLREALNTHANVFKDTDALYVKTRDMLIESRRRAATYWGFYERSAKDYEVYEYMIENEYDNFGKLNYDFGRPPWGDPE